MARPKKNNADYFSHDADMRNDIKIKAVRRKYGAKGYAIWCMLLEHLTHSDFFECSYNSLDLELLSGDFEIDPSELSEIINYFSSLQLISIDNEVLFSNTLKNRFLPLLSKRERDRTVVSDTENPHSKVKETIVDNTTLKKSSINNSLLSEIDISDVPSDLKKHFEIALLFQKLFIKNLTSLKSPVDKIEKAKFKAFVDPIRLAFERDKINRGEMKDAYDYLNSAQGQFWWPNIQSTKKLREKIPLLVAQKNSQQLKIKKDGNTNPKETKAGRTSRTVAEDFADFPVIHN